MVSKGYEVLVPGDLVAIAARDDRVQVVVDALARDAAEPFRARPGPSRNDFRRQVKAEVRRLRAETGKLAINA